MTTLKSNSLVSVYHGVQPLSMSIEIAKSRLRDESVLRHLFCLRHASDGNEGIDEDRNKVVNIVSALACERTIERSSAWL